MNTTFARLSGTYLVLMARVTCRWCFNEGKRGAAAFVIDPKRCPDYGGPNAPAWKRAIVRAAKVHYAKEHPSVKLPI